MRALASICLLKHIKPHATIYQHLISRYCLPKSNLTLLSTNMMPSKAFATLTPLNALARSAFSNLNDTLISGSRSTKKDALSSSHRMVVEAKRTFDREVFRLELESKRRESQAAYASDAETSESMPEPDSDMESKHYELGNIWIGNYELSLEAEPSASAQGYTVGKGPLESLPLDLLLCTKFFAKWHGINLRNPHARFNFFRENRGFYIEKTSRSQLAQLTVNGETVSQQPYALNQHCMIIRFDKLEYTFQWTDYAATKNFLQDRGNYVIKGLNGPVHVDVDMPTPLPNRRTIGRWTLGDALGMGAVGRVFLGTNSRGEVAAVKLVERMLHNSNKVDAEVQTCKEMTAFAQEFDEEKRIVRVVEVLYTNHEKFSPTVAFDNVAIVMQPTAAYDLAQLCWAESNGSVSHVRPQYFREQAANAKTSNGAKGMTMRAAHAFRDALLGLQRMHHGGWMHRDLKPSNIGLLGAPPRAFLLDIGTSVHLQPGTMMKPNVGRVGTLGFLAPEIEIEDYDHSIDIWAMGVVLYCLTHNDRPWKFELNPWCNTEENQKLRPHFEARYLEVIYRMLKDYHAASKAPTQGYIHREYSMHA